MSLIPFSKAPGNDGVYVLLLLLKLPQRLFLLLFSPRLRCTVMADELLFGGARKGCVDLRIIDSGPKSDEEDVIFDVADVLAQERRGGKQMKE